MQMRLVPATYQFASHQLRWTCPELDRIVASAKHGGLLRLDGERFDYETDFYRDLEKRYVQISEYYVEQKLYHAPLRRPIDFAFCGATTMNAFSYASLPPDRPFDFVGIHRGTIHTLYGHATSN